MIRWRLRMAAAERGVWTATELRRLLAQEADYPLSAPSVGALLTGEPSQVRLSTLLALCTALRCTPNDLFDLDALPASTESEPSGATRPSGGPHPAGAVRPVPTPVGGQRSNPTRVPVRA